METNVRAASVTNNLKFILPPMLLGVARQNIALGYLARAVTDQGGKKGPRTKQGDPTRLGNRKQITSLESTLAPLSCFAGIPCLAFGGEKKKKKCRQTSGDDRQSEAGDI